MKDNLNIAPLETNRCEDANLIIKNRIVTLLEEKGLANINFVKAIAFTDYADFIRNEHKGYGVKYDIGHDYVDHPLDDAYYNPETSLAGVKTIISFIMPYQLKDKSIYDTELRDHSNNFNDGLSFKISQAAIFKDYHLMIKEKVSSTLNYINNDFHEQAVVYADRGPLNDRAVLLSTGDYRVLRSSMLWHRDFGSTFYIGYILTTLDLEADWPVRIKQISDYFHPFCEKCGKCAKYCPNKAIVQPGHLSSQSCVSYLTQTNDWEQLKDKTLAGYVYGCDICQMVCPLNSMTISEQYKYRPIIDENIKLSHIDKLSNRQFKAKYNQSSAGWIGKKRFIRNIKENMRQYNQQT